MNNRSRTRRPRRRRASFRPPSPEVLAARREAMPEVTYPQDLPVTQHREDIAQAITDNQVVIVAGETGSGKTTQLPKICLDLGYGIAGTIGHTQPRRLAARTVASRIAEELGTSVGETVGYQVRFTDQVSSTSLIKLMTDGILLNEIQRDPLLRRYEVIIVDEAHERSLNIDFLLGYLKQLLPQRPDLKVIITSATIDSEKFAAHFGSSSMPAPVIEVSGRTYPVEIRYRPFIDDDTDLPGAICSAVDELLAAGPGDILVFCAGERDIREADEALSKHLGSRYLKAGQRTAGIEVLPLYARLSAAEQQRVFQPRQNRRVVLATNVAETSLTVPGIRYVVDPGLARISRYSNRTKVQRLPIEPISQASANQRAGRSGRVAPGIAIRLYEQQDFDSRPEFTEPEVLRTSLASVILQMTALGLGDIAKFPFIDPPDTRAIRDGINLLHELGAMDAAGKRLTRIGRQLSRLPIDPRLGRMLLEAGKLGCVRDVMIIVAALSIQDVRERPAEHQQAADESHARFKDETSDFLALLNLWDYLQTQQKQLSRSAFRRLAKREFLHYLRIREWQDVFSQLRQLASSVGIKVNRSHKRADADLIHQAILSGLLSHIGSWSERTRDYHGTRGARFVIFPGSHLARKKPEWVMAAELVETSRLFARVVAEIDPEWVEPLATHLVKRSFSDPYWSTRRGSAMARERVTLLGVAIVVDRPIPLSKVDEELAHEMFIRHGLVQGEWDSHHEFLSRNEDTWREAQDLTARARRPDLLVDEEDLVDFYLERLPGHITNGAHFDTWWKTVSDPAFLDYTLDLLVPARRTIDTDAFPELWTQGDLTFPLTYQFTPGQDGDGVMVHIPLALLPQVQPQGFDWLVPGLVEELVLATIRGLPKKIRVNLVPAPDTTQAILPHLPDWHEVTSKGEITFAQAFAKAAYDAVGTDVPVEAVHKAQLPPHLRMTFRVVDDRGVIVEEGDDLQTLQQHLHQHSAQAVRTAVRDALSTARKEQYERQPTPDFPTGAVKEFPHTDIPHDISTTQAGASVRGYPTLVAAKEGVELTILPHPDPAAHAVGVKVLIAKELKLSTNRVTSRWNTELTLAMAQAPDHVDDLVADLHIAAVSAITERTGAAQRKQAGLLPLTEVKTRLEFDTWVRFLRDLIEDEVYSIAQQVGKALGEYARMRKLISDSSSVALLGVLTDIKEQVSHLIYPGFIRNTPPQRIGHLARYLKAAGIRIDKAKTNPHGDETHAWVVRTLTEEWRKVSEVNTSTDSQRQATLADVRWQLEELRVSLFAQQLGTAAPVSEKRIRRMLA